MSSDPLERVRTARAVGDVRAAYDDWAAKYDADVLEKHSYTGPTEVAGVFARYMPSDSRVLDAGAGTGLTGVALRELGFSDIVGIDLSEAMLEVARARGVHRELRQMDLVERLDFEPDSFDGAIASGVFTAPYALAPAFDELARVTRPGGYVVVDLRPEHEPETGALAKFESLRASGVWELIEETERSPYIADPGEPPDEHVIFVHRRLRRS
jgi:predicted TPR repeat methyltransferase